MPSEVNDSPGLPPSGVITQSEADVKLAATDWPGGQEHRA